MDLDELSEPQPEHVCVCTAAGVCPYWDRPVSVIGVQICRTADPWKIAGYFGIAKQREAFVAPADEPVLDPDLWITAARLTADAAKLILRLPSSIDAIVGIARSGLLPATIAATHWHLPLWQLGRGGPLTPVGSGGRMRDRATSQQPRHVALIDDTAAGGGSMREAMRTLGEVWPGTTVTRAVVYCHPQGRRWVDLAAAILPGKHFLAWNFPNSGHAERSAFDFDGVLCENGDGRTEPKPLYLPRRRPIPLIITGRAEQHRGGTIRWLAKHGASCDMLIMRPREVRDDAKSIARWKADEFRQSRFSLFVESESDQGPLIAELARKPVLCIGCQRVIRPTPRSAKPRQDKGCGDCGGSK